MDKTNKMTNWKELVPKKKEHIHLRHTTRDEDEEGGWCDTCQDTFEVSTLFCAGYNKCHSGFQPLIDYVKKLEKEREHYNYELDRVRKLGIVDRAKVERLEKELAKIGKS